MQRVNIVQTFWFDKESSETNNEIDLKITDYYYY